MLFGISEEQAGEIRHQGDLRVGGYIRCDASLAPAPPSLEFQLTFHDEGVGVKADTL